MKKDHGAGVSVLKIIIFIVIIIYGIPLLEDIFLSLNSDREYSDKIFYLISSSENEVFDSEIQKFAKKEGFKIQIDYDDTLKITRRLNNEEKYDAVWLSNSIWMYSLDSNKVKVTNTKSTSINPIVFAIRKSKAEELGFLNRELYTQDIVNAVEQGKLKFSMSNPITTNSGASAYLGILTTLAGNPEVLTQQMIEDSSLKERLKTFFSGMERSSGSEDFLEELFVKGDYEAVFTYESSIININQKLEKEKKETLYALYPVDGVSISDSPIGYIDQKSDKKKAIYDKLVQYLVGEKGQKLLAQYGRRTWYGGINNKADQKVFNPSWGINTSNYISPLKYPSTSVIRHALSLYQNSLRKPVHVVFCLDYSGSMYGERNDALLDAMDYILTERAALDLLQFSSDDVIDIIPFSSDYSEVWHSSSVDGNMTLLEKIKARRPSGGTALFPAVEFALDLLKEEDFNHYNVSIIAMTDGEGNIGTFKDLKSKYSDFKTSIPIYSIQFGNASEKELKQMADLSNGKVFDGTKNLVDAFLEVRGYN